MLQACGLIPKISKCTLVPSTYIKILGVIVNSISITVSLPKTKERKILEVLTLTLRKKFIITARELAKIIGKLLSSTIVCPLGTLHYRSLEKAKLRALRLNGWDWNCHCKLDEDCYSELKWWLSNLPNTAAPIHRPNPHPMVFSDACSTGWGGYFQGQYAQGHFLEGELPLSINIKETLAIYYTSRSFLHQLKGNHILLQSDNTTAISYVHKMGGMQSEFHTKIVTDLWCWAVSNDCWLSISHVAGINNIDTDLVSCVLNERTEWQLLPSIFKEICVHYDVNPILDLFASCLNKKIDRYYSFVLDPFCEHVDCFTTTWNEIMYYAFPPFNLILRTLTKIRRD